MNRPAADPRGTGRAGIVPATALTIAGSDPSGGAGIQADLKTFEAVGVYGMSVLTALTAQNTVGVQGVHEVPPAFVAAQFDSVASDVHVDAAKTGMLASAPIVAAVAERVAHHHLDRIVVDPVAASKHGDTLLRPDAVAAVRDRLLPLALVATPNLGEVALLADVVVRDRRDLHRAAEAFLALGPRWVLVKGGHLGGDEEAVDLLSDGDTTVEVSAPRVPTRDTHGTGCTLSAAIAAHLALQDGASPDVPAAVRAAKAYVTGALQRGVRIGAGIGPVDHQWQRR